MSEPTSTPALNPWRGRLQLLLIVLGLGLVYTFVLPWLAGTDLVRQRNERYEQLGIDPAATFYTDHPMVDQLLRNE